MGIQTALPVEATTVTYIAPYWVGWAPRYLDVGRRGGCWGFYILVTTTVISRRVPTCASTHTHGDFIILPHSEARPTAPWHDIPLSHIILTLGQPVLIMSSAWLGSDKNKLLSQWFDSARKQTPISWMRVLVVCYASHHPPPPLGAI